jgi:YD repeat-containing protein
LRKIKFYKTTVYFLVTLLILSSILPGLVNRTEAATPESFLDPYLEDWLPQPGKAPSASSNLPGNQGSNLLSIPESSPSLIGSSSVLQAPPITNEPEEPVQMPDGELSLERSDFTLSSAGLPVTIQRLYKSNNKDELSPFGYGWTFPYQFYIQMFADFNISEFRSDGSQVNYTFNMKDENLLVDEFDGDPLIYYPLDQGTYTADNNAVTKLERVSIENYRVTHPDGSVYTFKGYKAPWRENQDPVAGKLLSVEDRKGNRVELTYNASGQLTQISDPFGRTVTLGYEGNLVTTMKDPLNRVTTYQYENQLLKKVIHPEGTIESFTYDSSKRLTSVTDSKTGTKAFSYDGDKISKVEHEGELKYLYQYEEGKVFSFDALNNKTEYQYDTDKKITKKIDRLGQVTSYVYDERDRLTQTIHPLQTVTMSYDNNDNLVTNQNSFGE